MALSQDKDTLMTRLNEESVNEHQKSEKRAKMLGRPLPVAPEPLKPEDVEFPKWVYFGGKGQLVGNEQALRALPLGWTESPADAAPAPAKPK